MSSNARIRAVELDDSAALDGLFVALGCPAPPAAIRRRLARLRSDPTYAAWVAVRHESIVGFAAGHIVYPVEEDNPAAQMIALVVAPRRERTGVGTALVHEFETWAHSNGAARALVHSGEQRRESHDFYDHCGYTVTGLRFNKTLPDLSARRRCRCAGVFMHPGLDELVDDPGVDPAAEPKRQGVPVASAQAAERRSRVAEAIAVAALVMDAKILLAHRHPHRRWYPNCWDLIGGHIETGESPEQALRRECREEIGVDLVKVRPLEIHLADANLEPHAFLVTDWRGTPVNAAPEEHDALEWFGLSDLPKLTLADPSYPAWLSPLLQ